MLSGMKIAFVGSGAMGEAIIKGVLDAGLTTADAIVASDPVAERRQAMESAYGIGTSSSNIDAVRGAEIVILCVKPQTLEKAAPDLRQALSADALVISIIAGARISTLRRALGHERIVRSMPNTPAQIGKGMTVWMATPAVTETQRGQASAVLAALGAQISVAEEPFLDMATGLSGSGPGYVFLIIEAMIDAAVRMGFYRADAEQLVLQTLEGSVALARESGIHPAELRNRVTSPAGTTAAGLYELEAGGLRALLDRAIFAAYRRSEELGDLSEEN